jgi:uncharacterized protein
MKVGNVEFTRSLNDAMDLASVEGCRLLLRSNARCDNFNDPDGKLTNSTAPVLLSSIDNTKPFTFSAKVTPEFAETYDAGALYVYVDETSWVKFAFERDERARTRIVSVRTIGTSDDNNHDVVTSTSVTLKIASDTRTIGYYYSVDAQTWQLVRLYRNDYPEQIWLGLSAQSPLGNGTTAVFEECAITAIGIRDVRTGI